MAHERSKLITRQFVISTIAINSGGALLTFLYFTFFDEIPLSVHQMQSVPPHDKLMQILFFGGVLLVIFVTGNRLVDHVFRQVHAWLRRLEDGESPSDVPPDIRRKVIGYAPRHAMINFAMWLLAGVCWFTIHLFHEHSLESALRHTVGVIAVGGVLTTALFYFVTELIWRPAIPIFFPDGNLSSVKERNIPIMNRLLVVFLLIGLWPSTLLVKLSLERADALVNAADPSAILHNLLMVEMSILIVGILVSAGLALFMTRGFTGPLQGLQGAMKRVEQNDLDVRVPVTSNDELGNLAEGFNSMTDGLRRGALFHKLLNLYVAPEVAREAIEHGASLGGVLTECTVLFSDIRRFTSLSESIPPERLITLLNRYMTAMVAVTVRHGGMVNKFGGDSLLAVFGTPLNPSPVHAASAIRAAIDMRRALAEFNVEQAQANDPTLKIGIGIATGPAVAGNIGGKERIEYTVIGDTVNLASRLQNMTRELEADTLMNAKACKDASQTIAFDATPLPPIQVRGKREPVAVYALQGNVKSIK